jgi:hypothetical protein
MQQPIQDGCRQGAIVVKYLGPVLECAVRGNHGGALLIAQADHLKQQVGSGLVNGEVAELIQDEQGRLGVFLELCLESPGDLGLGQCIDHINSAGKKDSMALETSGVAQGRG